MEKVNKNTEKSTESGREKRLKNLRPAWKKGDKSPNPSGRPKGQRDYATIYREALIKIANLNETTPEQIENEMIANAALLARKGDYRFYKDLLDRLHGTAIQKQELSGTVKIEKLEEIQKATMNILSNETISDTDTLESDDEMVYEEPTQPLLDAEVKTPNEPIA